MTTQEVFLEYSQARIARLLGIHRSAPGQWGTRPPYLRQLAIEHLTEGRLRADPPPWATPPND